MIVLPNMGLVKWDSINDFFSHEQLAGNFQAIDEHNHTPGKGKQIPYGGLGEQSVGKENLREGAFDASLIANESIETIKIKNKAITEGKIADGGVSSAKLKPTSAEGTSTGTLEPIPISSTEVPGLKVKITATVASTLRVWAVASAECTESKVATLQAEVKVDSTVVWGGSATVPANVEAVAVVPIFGTAAVAAGEHTVTVWVRVGSPAGGNMRCIPLTTGGRIYCDLVAS